MITILPADKAFLQSVAAPEGNEAMVLRDNDGSVFGHALFRMAGERATLGFCANEALVPMLLHLEFAPVEGGYEVSLAQFFRGECHCK